MYNYIVTHIMQLAILKETLLVQNKSNSSHTNYETFKSSQKVPVTQSISITCVSNHLCNAVIYLDHPCIWQHPNTSQRVLLGGLWATMTASHYPSLWTSIPVSADKERGEAWARMSNSFVYISGIELSYQHFNETFKKQLQNYYILLIHPNN